MLQCPSLFPLRVKLYKILFDALADVPQRFEACRLSLHSVGDFLGRSLVERGDFEFGLNLSVFREDNGGRK